MKKHSPRNVISSVLVVLGFVIALAGYNIIKINSTTDGTENYTGAKLEAAQTMLGQFDNFDNGIGTTPNLTKLRVKSVVYSPRYTLPACSNPNDSYSYSVTLETVSWFGIIVNSQTDSVCRKFGGSTK